jgi:ABC-2 type transport system ATP-binding protein
MNDLNIIEVNNLSKKYQNEYAVKDLNFTIEKNSVVGLIGPNGAGKTTTMKLLMGLIKNSGGNIKIANKDITYGVIPDDVRYLQDVPGFYDYMTAFEYLNFILNINNYTHKNLKEKINNSLKLVDLYDSKDKRIGKFSRGMKQRLGIAANIISDPKILILDEPVSALDPIGRKEIFDQINKLKNKMTIIFSTHVLDDIERVCDKIILINKGAKIKEGSISEIKKDYIKNIIEIIFANKKGFNQFKESFVINTNNITFIPKELKVFINDKDINLISQLVFSFLANNNIQIESFIIKKPTLEEIFIEEVLAK